VLIGEQCMAKQITHLVGDVRPRLADITPHLAHDADVVVAV